MKKGGSREHSDNWQNQWELRLRRTVSLLTRQSNFMAYYQLYEDHHHSTPDTSTGAPISASTIPAEPNTPIRC
uniref:Uncharacterized protein n=1 Tax=Arion vulgaris TaxID=1028688 RepID=A0A0B7BFY0_9EUPU